MPLSLMLRASFGICVLLTAGCPSGSGTSTDGDETSTSTGDSASSSTTSSSATSATEPTSSSDPTSSTTSTETSDTASSTTEPGPGVCGDGVVDGSEACDDGNDDGDDGCNAACERTAVVEWTYTYDGANSDNDYAEGVAIDPSGRIVVVGVEYVDKSDGDGLVIVLSPDGQEVWRKTWDGAGGFDHFHGVVTDDAGNIYVTGATQNGLQIEAITRKLDPDGSEVWIHAAPGPELQDAAASAVALAADGLYTVGKEHLPDQSDQLFVRRHDLDTGDAVWTTTTKAEHVGAFASAVTVAGDTIAVAGNVVDDEAFSFPLVVLLNKEGEILTAAVDDQDFGEWRDIAAIGESGELLLAGAKGGGDGQGYPAGVLRRVGADLGEQWTWLAAPEQGMFQIAGVDAGPGEAIFIASHTYVMGDGNFFFGARFAGDGVPVWTHSTADDHLGEAEDVAVGDGFVVLAGTESLPPQEGGRNVWVRRLAAD